MKKLILTSIAVLVLSTNLVEAASFDCTKASTEFEKSICNDKQLSDLDEKLAKVYKKLKSTGDNANIKQDQIAWIKETRKCGSDSNCIQVKYQERLAILSKSLETKVENIKEAPPATEASNSQNGGANDDEIVTNDLVSQFKSVWCKNIDNETRSVYKYKDLSSGDICSLPDIFISNLMKIGKNYLDGLNQIQSPVSMELDSSSLEIISNNDYRFRRAVLAIIPATKKNYIATFVVGVCPEDSTNSLNDGNSFRKALENKYGKIDGVITEKDVKEREAESYRKMQQSRASAAITVKEAKDARALDRAATMLEEVANNEPNDVINSVFWNVDGKTSMMVTKMSAADVFHEKLDGCNSENYFHFIYMPSPKLADLLLKADKANSESTQKHSENALTPKF